ncbi:tripartite tricarboxylate transporter substrate binding protein, partial [Achromobacter denitrificans]|nr:tripartite tricarboxylate transporter substrate binding protein [Achromobacter denitrificans]
MKTNRVLQHLAASLALAAGLSGGAQAQDYPSRPVTTIVPFAAGGASDLLARQLGKQLSTKLGQAF